MDSDTSFTPPNISPEYFLPTNTARQTSGITVDAQAPNAWQTRGTDLHAAPSGSDVKQDLGMLGASQIQDKDDDDLASIPVDLADEVEGMYRLMDLISESGSNGCDPLRRFINAISPGAYASITEVDFKILDQLSIKPLGIYGCKDEIVRLLLSIGAVDKKLAHLLLAPSDVGDSQRTLSSGLYIVTASTAGPTDERHYIIYWPEDSTWEDSAASSVCRNRVTFMRYLTKMCDQVVALMSADHSASIVWNDEDRDSVSVDMDSGDSERLFTFEVAKTNEQEESAVSRPGFQMNSRVIVPNETPLDCQVDPSLFVPRLLPGETVQALGGLLPEQCNEWLSFTQHIRDIFVQEKTKKKSAIARNIANTEDSLQRALREEVVDHVINCFPSLDRDGLFPSIGVHDASLEVESRDLGARLSRSGSPHLLDSVRLPDIRAQYPTFESIFEKYIKDTGFDDVPSKGRDFRALKLGVLSLWRLQSEHQHMRPSLRSALIQALVFGHDFQQAFQLIQTRSNFFVRMISSFWSDPSGVESFKNEMRKTAARVSDSQFLQQLEGVNDEDLRIVAQNAKALAQTGLSSSIDAVVKKITHAVLAMQQDICGREVQPQVENEEREVLKGALVEFIREINKKSAKGINSTIYLDRVEMRKERRRASGIDYRITGRWEMPKVQQVPQIELCVHPMDLTSDDRHNMQLDSKYVPTPTINDRLSSSFRLPISMEPAFYQLLENEKFLLVLADRDKFFVFLERLPALDMAIHRGKPIKSLNRDKLGRGVLFAFDETKRTLAVCASTKGQGRAIDLAPWYSDAENFDSKMTSVCGKRGSRSGGLLRSGLVSSVPLSIITGRPASVQLQTPPNYVYSSPDGSCLLILHIHDSWANHLCVSFETFGSTEGIALDVPDSPLKAPVLTSMSIAIDITKKVTEFMFKEKGNKHTPNTRPTQAQQGLDTLPRSPSREAPHNHHSLSERRQKTLTFIAENHTKPFASYFSDLVQTFERTTRKPTGDELSGIKVSAAQFRPFWDRELSASDWMCLAIICSLGEWVLSAELERSLLGAEVNQIVDKLSFGWYESIFQSYLALKPVKVVSSMGQQSVGKSFALNHLVDTSFAGSHANDSQTLVIIIKDVVEPDTVEITREFSLKFQQIVRQEQDANFISRLHGVVRNTKKRLDSQKISHPAAGEFLYTIKTLMAKLKNFDSDLTVECEDTVARFAIFDREQPPPDEIESISLLYWNHRTQERPTGQLVDLRVDHVKRWLDSNLERFEGGHAAIEDLRRSFDRLVIEMTANVQLCRVNARHVISSAFVVGYMRATTAVKPLTSVSMIVNFVGIYEALRLTRRDIRGSTSVSSTLTYVVILVSCREAEAVYKIAPRWVDATPFQLELMQCQVVGHTEDEHMCSALVHMCGEVRLHLLWRRRASSASDFVISHTSTDSLPARTTCVEKRIRVRSHVRPQGFQIDTSPQSIEATFTGRHETFQYTKYTQGPFWYSRMRGATLTSHTAVAKRMQCVLTIPPGLLSHVGGHIHSKESQPFHFCEMRSYPAGTRNKSRVHDADPLGVDGPDGASLELGGRKFSSNDEGAPMMCNLVCSSMGRHVHIDYCRADQNGPCDSVGVQHINDRMLPDPDKPKDAVTHSLYWRRMGSLHAAFLEISYPYTRDEGVSFSKCDAMCSGSEHSATETAHGQPQPSYCTLPMFHPPKSTNYPVDGVGYISDDGHMFSCKNPAIVQQAFHVFWSARHAAVTSGQQTIGARRDAYSVILFNATTKSAVVNDFTSSPDQLLDIVLDEQTEWGTDFAAALQASQAVMADNWSTE
ncbi:hypothetical protein BJY52DRAFT_1224795, partial [Lactarius psammicola]